MYWKILYSLKVNLFNVNYVALYKPASFASEFPYMSNGLTSEMDTKTFQSTPRMTS